MTTTHAPEAPSRAHAAPAAATDPATDPASDRVGRIETHGDHRIAMAFGVLGALPDNEIDIVGPECVSVSYPSFWSDLRRVA